MSSAFALFDSRVSEITLLEGRATIYFSVAYIHKSRGTPGKDPASVWVQEAVLVMDNATLTGAPPLPSAIAEGVLEVGGVKFELLPLPFKRKVAATLRLTFADGSRVEVIGERPIVELLGQSLRLEDSP